MLYPNGSDLPLGHLIMHKPICTRHSMDPIPIIDCPASFPLTWCPCVLGGQSNPIEAPSILCCCLEHLLNGLYGKKFAQSQDPNLSCPGVASTQPPLVSNEIARIQPQAQCSFHPHWKFHFPMLSSYMPISLFHWIS